MANEKAMVAREEYPITNIQYPMANWKGKFEIGNWILEISWYFRDEDFVGP
jgi:hypothetical protein